MPKDPVSILKRFEVLNGMSADALKALARFCTWHSVPAGKQIILAKEKCGDVYFIASGKVRILLYSAAEGRPVLYATLGPYQMFGEISAIDGQPRSATAEACEECRLAILTEERFKRLLVEHPPFAFAVMRQLASQVRRLSRRVFEFSTLGVQNRVLAELLRCAIPSADQNGQALLSPPPGRAELAARISTSREAVSRVITRLEEQGVVRREGSDIRILELERLRKLVTEAEGGQ